MEADATVPVPCIAREAAVQSVCKCPTHVIQTRRYRKLRDAGLITRTPNDVAWAILDRLTNAGWTSQAIASATGIPWPTVQGWLTRYGKEGFRTLISPGRAEQLLTYGEPTTGSIGAYAARRRLQGLAVMGWDLDSLTRECGIAFSTLACVRNGTTARVRVERHREIAAMTSRLMFTPGKSDPAKLHAVRHHWLPLLAWDEIDDPDERPTVGYLDNHKRRDDVDEVVVDRVLGILVNDLPAKARRYAIDDALAGTTVSAAEKGLIVRRAVAAGVSRNDIETALKLAGDTFVGYRDGQAA